MLLYNWIVFNHNLLQIIQCSKSVLYWDNRVQPYARLQSHNIGFFPEKLALFSTGATQCKHCHESKSFSARYLPLITPFVFLLSQPCCQLGRRWNYKRFQLFPWVENVSITESGTWFYCVRSYREAKPFPFAHVRERKVQLLTKWKHNRNLESKLSATA